MPNALEYANIIAQMMRQSAEAQVENDARREDMAFRRQQAADALALQRENLALDRQRTEAQIATESERRAGMESDRKRAERNDTVASIDEQMYQMEYGENPTQTKMRLGRRKEEAGVAAAESQASILAAEAEDTPSKIAMGRRKDEAALKASEAQMRAADTQNRALEADMRFNGMMEQFKLDAAKESARGQRMENMERESSLYEAMTARAMNAAGIISPAQQTAIQLEVAKMVPQAQIKAAFSAATVNDPLRGEVFDPTIFDARMKSLQAATGLATDLASFKVSDPEGHAALQKRTSEAVMTALEDGASPQAAMQIAQTMVSAAAESRKAAESRTMPPIDDTVETESKRRLKVKESEVSARAQDIKKDVIEKADNAFILQIESMFPGKTADQIAQMVAPEYDVELKRIFDGKSIFARGVSQQEKQKAFFAVASRLYSKSMK